ncbi:MAG: glycosyltransferase family 2 protein [bacterium]|nr:glycosyltransferase family 2 protein [bacterium]
MNGDSAVSVLIPAWDEEDAIGGVVSSAIEGCRAVRINVECLVCVDGRTSDSTARRASEAGARVVAQQGRGLTAAVLELATVATADVCVVLDGDGQHDGGSAARLAAPILADVADLVVGERDPTLLRDGFGRGLRGHARYAGACLVGALARLAVGGRNSDPLTGMFACRREDLIDLSCRRLDAPPSGYKLLLGLVVALPEGRIRRMTVPFLPRDAGASKLGSRVAATAICQLLRLVVRRYCFGTPSRKGISEFSAG